MRKFLIFHQKLGKFSEFFNKISNKINLYLQQVCQCQIDASMTKRVDSAWEGFFDGGKLRLRRKLHLILVKMRIIGVAATTRSSTYCGQHKEKKWKRDIPSFLPKSVLNYCLSPYTSLFHYVTLQRQVTVLFPSSYSINKYNESNLTQIILIFCLSRQNVFNQQKRSFCYPSSNLNSREKKRLQAKRTVCLLRSLTLQRMS